MARPTKLTPELQAEICAAVASGMSLEGAARYAGIRESTLFAWKQRGEQGDEKYTGFLEAIKRAEGLIEHELVNAVMRAARSGATGTWQAAMTMLERKWPRLYARRETIVQETTQSANDNADHKQQLARAEAVVAALKSAEEEAS